MHCAPHFMSVFVVFQFPSSPPPLTGPVPQTLSLGGSFAGDDGLLSCVLPDDLLVEILSERFLLTDCQRGLVFDSLDTLFAQNQVTACRSLLKALNNRKYMYMISLKQDFFVLKEREKEEEETKGGCDPPQLTRAMLMFVCHVQNWRRWRLKRRSVSVWKTCPRTSTTRLMTSPKHRLTASDSRSRRSDSRSECGCVTTSLIC